MAAKLRSAKVRAPKGKRGKAASGDWGQDNYWSTPWPQDAPWWSNSLGLPPPNSWPAPESLEGAVEAADAAADAGGGEEEGGPDAAQATESLLDALAPGMQQPHHGGPRGRKAATKRSWVVAAARPVASAEGDAAAAAGVLAPENLLGHWVDSQGNAVHVLSTDAYSVRLEATLSRPPRSDIHLSVKPVMLGAGWQCGHSLLDPLWTTPEQLHWVAMDGRVSVWVRPQDLGDFGDLELEESEAAGPREEERAGAGEEERRSSGETTATTATEGPGAEAEAETEPEAKA